MKGITPDGNYTGIRVDGYEAVRKSLLFDLERRLRTRLRNGRKHGYLEDSQILGTLRNCEPGKDSRYEGILERVIYPLATEVLESRGFSKNEERWVYTGP